MSKFGVSQPVNRREDNRLLTGTGRFIDDFQPDDVLFGLPVRARRGHARIKALDVAAAREVPGVVAVLTAEDLAAAGVQPIAVVSPAKPKEGGAYREQHQPLLARDQVRYVGDAVAFVVAESEAAARDAAELVDIDDEPLPAPFGCDRAADASAPALYDDGNLCFEWEQGDAATVGDAFAAATHVSRLDVINNRVVLNAIETRGCLAAYDPAGAGGRGKFTLTVPTQMPNPMQKQVAQVLGLDLDQVRIVVPDVGGGFGGKNSLFPEYGLCLFAARQFGRPVKWMGDRSDAFITDFHGRDNVMTGQMAFDADGRITAIRVDSFADLGAYTASRGPVSPVNGFIMLSNTYRIPAMYAHVTAVHTATVPTDPYRGAGRPEVTYLIERLIDVAAAEQGIDRVELRRRNLIPTDAFPYRTPTGLNYEPCDFAGVMDAAMARTGWADIGARRAEAAARGRLRGIGMSNYIERCGGGGGLAEAARIEFAEDGALTVYSGAQANGQGHETAFSQIIHEHLGLPFEQIRVVEGDTDQVHRGIGTGGSWSIPMGGGAISLAAEKVIEKARRVAGHLLEAAEADLEFADGRFRVAGTDVSMTLRQVAIAAQDPARLPAGETPGLDQEAEHKPDNFTYPYGCHIAEVEIDPDTGAVDLVNYACVHDFGRALNPNLLAGQVHGGVTQGIGQALMEHTVFDDDGQMLSGSFMDYCLPRADDLPAFDFAHQDTPTAHNILGMKGCGEAGATGAPPAVINAVVDALAAHGVRHIDMPATPDRVWTALRAAG